MEKQEKYNSQFATRLRGLIAQKGTTITAISKALGISRQAVSQYTDGTGQPNVNKLVMIADYFGVSVDYLVGLSDVPAIDKDQKLSIACEVTGLSYEAILQILDLKDNFGYAGMLSALLESPFFAETMHKVFSALSSKQSAAKRVRESWPEDLRAIADTNGMEDVIGKDAIRTFSRYSDDYAIVPRLGLSESFLQAAQDKFKSAALEAIGKVESNHSMDEILLQIAKAELLAFD